VHLGQHAPGLLQADVEVDPIGPDIDIVHVIEAPLGEGPLFGLPGLGEAGDDRGRQDGGRAKNSSRARAKSPELMPCR